MRNEPELQMSRAQFQAINAALDHMMVGETKSLTFDVHGKPTIQITVPYMWLVCLMWHVENHAPLKEKDLPLTFSAKPTELDWGAT